MISCNKTHALCKKKYFVIFSLLFREKLSSNKLSISFEELQDQRKGGKLHGFAVAKFPAPVKSYSQLYL